MSPPDPRETGRQGVTEDEFRETADSINYGKDTSDDYGEETNDDYDLDDDNDDYAYV